MSGSLADAPALLWSGSVPICLTLSDCDRASTVDVSPCYILAPRMAFLQLVVQEKVDHLRAHAMALRDDEVWYSCEGLPLRAHLPIGVLFDMHCRPAPAAAAQPPWRITVHFQAFPHDKLIKIPNKQVVQRLYSHDLKQSLFLLHGNTSHFNSLRTEQQTLLWSSICGSSHEGFEIVAKSLKPAKAADVRVSIPVRFLHGPTQPPVQPPLKAHDASGAATTLRDALLASLSRRPEAGAATTAMAPEDYACIVQGVDVPLAAPLYELWAALCHPDLFLYVTLRAVEVEIETATRKNGFV